jgi:hypothetical protein
VIAVNAKDANAHFNLGLLLRKEGQTTEGNAEVQTAANLDSSLRAKATQLGVPLTGSYGKSGSATIGGALLGAFASPYPSTSAIQSSRSPGPAGPGTAWWRCPSRCAVVKLG